MAVTLPNSRTRLDALTRFERIERSQIPAWVWIVVIWALFVFPAIALRAYHYEEGTVVGLARGALEDSHWLAPQLYGERFVERPVLMSWLIAGIGMLVGGINQWVARIPTIVSVLAGGLLVFSFVRPRASALAGLFAAVCFLVSPIILQKVIVAEPDILLTVLLFAAFVMWWNGYEGGGVSLARWIAIGAVLALAGLTKGPQPLAYFGLGVGAFLLLRRQWSSLWGLALASAISGIVTLGWYWLIYQPGDVTTWAQHSRLVEVPIVTRVFGVGKFLVTFVLEMMPSVLLAVPLAALVVRKPTDKSNDLPIALLLYATCCTVALMLWPHGLVRYAMPASLALAALAGLAFDRFRSESRTLVNVVLVVAACLCTYQVARSWIAMPLLAKRFERTRIAGNMIASAIRERPGMLYSVIEDMDKNILLYVPAPIRAVPFQALLKAPAPAWAILSPERMPQLKAARADIVIEPRAAVPAKPALELVELRAR